MYMFITYYKYINKYINIYIYVTFSNIAAEF